MGRRRSIEGSALPKSTTPATVPVSSIAHNPRNPRPGYDDVAELADSISEVGLLQPLGVVRYETFLTHYPDHEQDVGACDWVVLNGNRRLAAARKAGLDEVPVHVLDRLGRDDYLDESVLIENIHREALPPLREAQALQLLTERHGSQRTVAKRIGKTQGYVSQRLALLKLAPELRAALTAGQLRVEDARRVAKLPHDAQRTEWQRIQAGDYAVITPDQDDGGGPEPASSDYAVITPSEKPRRTRGKAPTMAVQTPEQVAAALRKHFDTSELATLVRLLTESVG